MPGTSGNHSNQDDSGFVRISQDDPAQGRNPDKIFMIRDIKKELMEVTKVYECAGTI
jgi:hypothetical protein